MAISAIDWTTWRGATCLPDCWCEAARVGNWILEPVNTWTNLFFVFAGIYFFIKSKSLSTNSNKLTSDVLFPRIYGIGLFILGWGSFFYHASETFVGQWLDVFGMYLVSMFYIFYNFFRSEKLNKKSFIIFYSTSCLLLGFAIYFWPECRRWLFGLSLIFTLIQTALIQLTTKPAMENRYLYAALLSYVVAQTVWYLDKNKIWCNPYGWINGHGIWHILSGIAAVLIYLYFQSEKKTCITHKSI